MCLHERLVQLLALEVQVTGRSYHAQDHGGVPHESIRSASIEEVRVRWFKKAIRTSACLKSQFS